MVVLHTINPMKSKKCVRLFNEGNRFFILTFIDFSKKIYEILFHKWGMPWRYVKLGTKSKIKKTYYWGRNDLLPRMPQLE